MNTESKRLKQCEATARWQAKKRETGGKALVICSVCGKRLLVVDTKHLRFHDMTSADYKIAFPDASTHSFDVLNQCRETKYSNLYKPVEITSSLASFLTGSLLGDGGLETTGNARYKETSGNREYSLWKSAFISNYFVARWSEGDYLSKQTGKTYHRCRLSTGCHPLLTEWRQRWYPDGKKIVCFEDVEHNLDALALAIWFYDDGNISRSDRDYRAHLYTLAFDPESVEKLVLLLRTRFDIECHRERVGKYFGICMPRRGRDRLIEIISEYPVPGMGYKLDAPQIKTPWWLRSKPFTPAP